MKYSLYYDVSTLGTDNVWYFIVNNNTSKAFTSTSFKSAIKFVESNGWPVGMRPDAFTHHICDFNTLEHLQQSMPELFV